MKTILLTTLIMTASFSAYADRDNAGRSEKKARQAQCQKEFSGATAEYEASEDALSPGSQLLRECESLSRGKIRSLYKSGSRVGSVNWDTYSKYTCCLEIDEKDQDKAKEQTKSCVDDYLKKAKRCESIAYLISAYDRSWQDEEQIMSTDSSGNNTAALQAAAKNGASVSQLTSAAATIKCKSAGIETLDYDQCKKFQVHLDLLEGATQVGYATQELVYKDKIMDSQLKHSSEENTATGALKAQGESLEMQKDMYTQRTAVDAGKLAYLYSIYNEFPGKEDIQTKCNGFNVSGKTTGLDGIGAEDCKDAARVVNGGFKTMMNQAQRDTMKSKLISIATSAGSNAILAGLMGKRADDVNKAIAKIDDYKPIDPFTVSEDEAISTYCKMNPGQPQCLTGGLDRTFDTLNDNIITFGEGGTGTSYGNINSITDSTSSTGTNDGSSSGSTTPVGSIIAAANKDNSIEGSTAAKVTEGGAGTSGGGGGGGVGGGGGGGGGGTPQAAAQGGVAAAVQGKTPSYGGGSGSISVMGGFGINKKKAEAKDGENPFGKMFGKDTPKGTGVVNFRDIASVGKKGDNLFDMISKRYTSVTADKRLLEYELAK